LILKIILPGTECAHIQWQASTSVILQIKRSISMTKQQFRKFAMPVAAADAV